MGRWTGQADANAETAGGGGGNFTPAPRGFYTIQVADYKEGVTEQTKRPKVTLECEIADQGEAFGKKVWVTITQIPKGEKGHGIMVHTLHAFGMALDGNYDFDLSDLQGRQARALIGIEFNKPRVKNGRTFYNDVNFVEAVYTDKHPQPDELPPAPEPRENKPAAAATSTARPSEAVQQVFGGGKTAVAERPKKSTPF